jgi:hydrogenase expression/formation protein HypE
MNNQAREKAQMGEFDLSCPLPIDQYPTVLLAHGGGGTLMHQLIGKVFRPEFKNPLLDVGHDGAVLPAAGQRLAFTTDSFVVRPLFFPGGDIGSLAVHGTVNDLAMCGARPLYLSAGFILEEGLPMETLWRIVQSMGRAAEAAGVQLVTGDTKVVERGKGDGVFINTSGVGIIEHDLTIAPQSVRPGDLILLNGDIGRHGIAVMAVREGLAFGTTIESDSAALSGLVLDLLRAGVEIHCLRDLTRGGLSSALVEIAETARVQIAIDERSIPVREEVQGACEILGLDPLYVANEGRFVAFVPSAAAEPALSILKAHPLGAGASVIGIVRGGQAGLVTMTTSIGGARMVDMLSGEQLPRIC